MPGRGVEVGGSEDLGCVTINFTWSSLSLCGILVIPSLTVNFNSLPLIFFSDNLFPSFPHENDKILPTPSDPPPALPSPLTVVNDDSFLKLSQCPVPIDRDKLELMHASYGDDILHRPSKR